MIAPAVRTVVIEVTYWLEDSNSDSDEDLFDESIYPVLAIRSRIVEIYQATRLAGFVTSATISNLEEDGYHLYDHDTEEDFLFLTEEFGHVLCTVEDIECSNVTACVVPCPWPMEEDAERFKDIIGNIRSDLKTRCQRKLAAENGCDR
jgi:hypothetical protein